MDCFTYFLNIVNYIFNFIYLLFNPSDSYPWWLVCFPFICSLAAFAVFRIFKFVLISVRR